MCMKRNPSESDLRFIIQYVHDHNKTDFGEEEKVIIPETEQMARKAYKEIGNNCNWVEEEFYYSMKQYFA